MSATLYMSLYNIYLCIQGRTGLVLVATLVQMGISLPQAIHHIRTCRPGCIHNPSQLMYLVWYSNHIRQLPVSFSA